MMLGKWLSGLCLFFGALPLIAQPTIPEPLTAENVNRFASVVTIDFAAAPPEAGEIASGVFASNRDASRLAVRNRAGEVVIFSDDGALVDVFAVVGADGLNDTVLDMALTGDGDQLAAIVSDGGSYAIALHAVGMDETVTVPFPFTGDIPLKVWFDPAGDSVWVEVAPVDAADGPYLVPLPAIDLSEPINELIRFERVMSAPETDPAAVVRLGRIPSPYAVTSSEDGVVKLWDLRQPAPLSTAQVDNIAMFGGINSAATHLAWRDPQSAALHLLDFTTGTDQMIDSLDGVYIASIMLSRDGDVILGADVGGEPIVVAWPVATGERVELGRYRDCGRPLDLARLSGDGTTLVIGCDAGFDIWRVTEG